MSSTAAAMMSRNGKVFRVTWVSGLPKREEDRNRFSPKGGQRKPASRLARKMTPWWIGSTPKALAAGTTGGGRAPAPTAARTLKRRGGGGGGRGGPGPPAAVTSPSEKPSG